MKKLLFGSSTLSNSPMTCLLAFSFVVLALHNEHLQFTISVTVKSDVFLFVMPIHIPDLKMRHNSSNVDSEFLSHVVGAFMIPLNLIRRTFCKLLTCL